LKSEGESANFEEFSFERSEKTSGNLDLLRTLAVLLVVISHLPMLGEMTNPSQYLLPALGLVGVGIFFVHTCLVLMMSLERLTLHEGIRFSGRRFLIRRIFRIYPLSISTVLTLAVIAYFNSGSVLPIPELLSNIFLVQNLTGHPSTPGPLWSLPYEVQMYFFLPALYVLITWVGTRMSAIKLLSTLLGFSIFLTITLWFFNFNYHLVKYIPAFLPGVFAYVLWGLKPRISAWVFFLSVGVVAAFFPWLVAMGFKENILLWPVCLGIGLSVPFVREIRSEVLKLIANRIAKYSYGIYLIHGPWIVFSFYYVSNVSIAWRWLIFIAGVALLSFLAYYLIEKPFIRFGVALSKGTMYSRA
jgi:peptidoglycan/LPS O-acetylase OafA/YrhL